MGDLIDPEATPLKQARALFGAVNRLDVEREVAGYAICAAELARGDLEQRLKEINDGLANKAGSGVLLSGVTEAFLFREGQPPKRIVEHEGRTTFNAAGILRGLVIFDRKELGLEEGLSLPWTDLARERLEICFDLSPDVSSMAPYRVGADTLAPVNKVEDISFYDAVLYSQVESHE